MKDCIFCKIVSGEIQSTKIYEDNEVLGFLDISPANKGHTLVITKKHFEILLDVPDDILAKLIVVTKWLSNAVMNGLNADGFNILMNNKKISGQLVPHVHFHIVPRFEDDGINLHWSHKKYLADEMELCKLKIIKHIIKN